MLYHKIVGWVTMIITSLMFLVGMSTLDGDIMVGAVMFGIAPVSLLIVTKGKK